MHAARLLDSGERHVRVRLVGGCRGEEQPLLGEHEHAARGQGHREQQRLAQVAAIAQLGEHPLRDRLGARVVLQRLLGAVHHARQPEPLVGGALGRLVGLEEVEGVGDALGREREEVEGARGRLGGQPHQPAPHPLDEARHAVVLRALERRGHQPRQPLHHAAPQPHAALQQAVDHVLRPPLARTLARAHEVVVEGQLRHGRADGTRELRGCDRAARQHLDGCIASTA
jgi:hypothetical protein